jgi:hypothetical protein
MDFRARMNAVLHHQLPDQVPFAPYDNLVPRGDFERMLRNRGMGLCLRRATIWEEMPNVSIETKNEGDISVKIYHTPVGDLTTRSKTHTGRIKDDDLDLDVEGLIKGIDDYAAAIFMIEDTILHMDESIYLDTYRDVGADGIVRDAGMQPPYGATRYLYGGVSGLPRWSQDQHDFPDHFERLVQAVIEREEKRLQLIVNSPAEYIGLGDLDGTWGPEKIRKYDLPLYQRWVPILKSKGKICALHAHALNLSYFKEIISEIGCDVIEAFTPAPVGNLSIAEARAAWGKDTVIWVNFPETIFWAGVDETKRYTIDLMKSDAPGNSLVIGFTEMGTWGAMTDQAERVFGDGTLAIMEAIEECGNYPIAVW